MRRYLRIVSEAVSFSWKNLNESEKSDARDALFQNLTSSPQTYTERAFLKEWNDLLILQKGA